MKKFGSTLTLKNVRAAPQMKGKKPKRPTGQFQSTRESEGKINGGGYGAAVAPASQDAFHKLGSK